MSAKQFQLYQQELVGAEENGIHRRTAELLGTSEIGVKRFAGGARRIPTYIAQSLRAMVLLSRKRGGLKALGEMP